MSVILGAIVGFLIGFLLWKLDCELIGSAVAIVGAGAIVAFLGFPALGDRIAERKAGAKTEPRPRRPAPRYPSPVRGVRMAIARERWASRGD